MNYIYAIEIELNDFVSTLHTNIGLYNEVDKSYFRWSESELVGVVTKQFKNGMIYSIGSISQDCDFSVGGCSNSANGFEIVIKNNDKFCFKLDELNINLNGCTCIIYEYVGTDSDSDSEEIYVQYTGVIQNLSGWDSQEFCFNVGSFQFKRDANISEFYDTDKIVPITFGSSDPENGRFFKAIRTINTETILTLQDFNQGGIVYPTDMNLFPIYSKIGESPSLIYQVQLGQMDAVAFQDASLFNEKYILIKEGAANGYRKIHNCSKITHGTNAILQIELYDFLEQDMTGNASGDAEDQSWIQFINIDRKYVINNMPCDGFYLNDIKIEDNAELYYKNTENIYSSISSYGVNIYTDNVYNNNLNIDPKFCENSPNDINSFTILPIIFLTPATIGDINIFYQDLVPDYKENGVILTGNKTYNNFFTEITGTYNNVIDRDLSTFYKLKTFIGDISILNNKVTLKHCFVIKLPKMPENFEFNSVYIGLKIREKSENLSDKLRISSKSIGYIGRLNTLFDSVTCTTINRDTNNYSYIDNIADFYPYINRNNNNKQLYTSELVENNKVIGIGNYKLIDLKCNNREQYNLVKKVMIVIDRFDILSSPSFNCLEETEIYDVCVNFVSTASIKEEVYL